MLFYQFGEFFFDCLISSNSVLTSGKCWNLRQPYGSFESGFVIKEEIISPQNESFPEYRHYSGNCISCCVRSYSKHFVIGFWPPKYFLAVEAEITTFRGALSKFLGSPFKTGIEKKLKKEESASTICSSVNVWLLYSISVGGSLCILRKPSISGNSFWTVGPNAAGLAHKFDSFPSKILVKNNPEDPLSFSIKFIIARFIFNIECIKGCRRFLLKGQGHL